MKEQYQKMYQERLTTPELAIKEIEPGDAMFLGGVAAEPPTILNALREYDGLKDNRMYRTLSTSPGFDLPANVLKQYTFFMSGFDRAERKKNPGIIDVIPNHLSDIGRIMQNREKEPIFMATVSPMDEDGNFSLGTTVNGSAEVLEVAKKIILEVNPNMPRTFGYENKIHISEVTALIESNAKIPELPVIEPNEKDLAIGKTIADMVQDGDTIQLGIGSMPSAVGKFLADKKDLSFHSEMMIDTFVDLYEQGVITNKNKKLNPGHSVANFAAGSRRLYDFMDNNEEIHMLRTDETNDPHIVGQLENFISINAAVEVDLYGQVSSEMIRGTYYSSTGGQAEFARGAHRAKNGKSVICLYSTAKDDQFSKIVPTFVPGTIVTTSKNDVDMIVTEYGKAVLKNRSLQERAEALIAIAHPNFREQLWEDAVTMKIIPAGFKNPYMTETVEELA